MASSVLNCCHTPLLRSPWWSQMSMYIMSTFLIYNRLHNGDMAHRYNNIWSTSVHICKNCLLIYEFIRCMELPKYQFSNFSYDMKHTIVTTEAKTWVRAWAWAYICGFEDLYIDLPSYFESCHKNFFVYMLPQKICAFWGCMRKLIFWNMLLKIQTKHHYELEYLSKLRYIWISAWLEILLK